jgi:hypothetical protein
MRDPEESPDPIIIEDALEATTELVNTSEG